MSQPEELLLELYAPGASSGQEDISQLVHAFSFGTNAVGGDGDCRVTINDAGAHDDAMFRAGSKLVISDDQGVLYCGRLEVPDIDAVTGFGRITHLFRGYASAADDMIYPQPKIWTEGTALEQIYLESCTDVGGGIAPGSIAAGGRVLPENSQDFLFGSAQYVWNTIAPLGGDSIPLVWQVYVDDVGINPVLHVFPRPTAVSYRTAMGTDSFSGANPIPGGTRVRVNGDLRQVYNRVVVKVTNGNNSAGCGCVTVDDSNSQSPGVTGVGHTRMIGIDLTSIPGVEAVDALRAGNMLLSQTSTLRTVGSELTLDYPQYVLGGGDAGTPLWRVRAGRIIKVVDLDTGDFLLGNELYIVSTRWDEPRRRLTIQVGQRNGLSEAIGRSIRARRPGRPDSTRSDPVPDVAREPRRGTVYDIVPWSGSTNRDVPYAPGNHSHGTPNGDIAMTYGLDGAGAAITTPAQTAMGLIQGTITSWQLYSNLGGLISYRLIFPGATTVLPGHEDPIVLPGGTVNILDATNGSQGTINLECLSNTAVQVEVTGVPTATWASLILNGTRNLIFSDPRTPLEDGTGQEGVEPP